MLVKASDGFRAIEACTERSETLPTVNKCSVTYLTQGPKPMEVEAYPSHSPREAASTECVFDFLVLPQAISSPFQRKSRRSAPRMAERWQCLQAMEGKTNSSRKKAPRTAFIYISCLKL